MGLNGLRGFKGGRGFYVGFGKCTYFIGICIYPPPPPVNITALCYFCNIFIYGIDMLEFWGIFIKGFEWLYNIIMAKIAF
ncbi:hypothetical protein [Helicobacter bilis]|uniref:hypothetical protein n=1 Tax=Helicobacter bilis TaxID=37372 RepID=UPI0010FDE83E|nr:hypothetical protein [Helicobacter bilis]TLE07069.1 hypothetical protein LS78_010730 [Helicobacter bilis]